MSLPVLGPPAATNSPVAFSNNSQHPTSPSSAASASGPSHIQYALNVDTAAAASSPAPISFSPSQMPHQSGGNASGGIAPSISGMRRRNSRAMTFRNVDDFADFEVRPGWQPGAEPGIDTTKPDGGRATLAGMNAPSEITVVDFSQSNISTTRLDNSSLAGFLAMPQATQMKCRWINVNGLSWDVIQMLGNHKKLHRLAIEDLMNTRNRTKADWYPTHTYMVLTLQKLVHIDDGDSLIDSDDDDDDESRRSRNSGHSWKNIPQAIKGMLGRNDNGYDINGPVSSKALEGGQRSGPVRLPGGQSATPHFNAFRTLQRYHASPNDARTEFMEGHSALSSRNLTVAAEQVSIFITSDNTVISFFELSAQDIEQPILKRLAVPDTALRRLCDASMVAQAILDAIIDLAIPVTVCYSDDVADLELDVLTRPSVNHTKSLYVAITEMNKVLSFVNPVMNLINTLRDHKAETVALEDLQDPLKGVIISPTTFVYLADVLDHCVLIAESLEQTKGQAENMISLIFNTISAYQNESMKQLTIVTIIFLPLTFLTGYFGQNFEHFYDLGRGIPFFWEIAGPVIFFTIAILMREMIADYIKSLIQRRHIISIRKHRQKRKKRA